MDDQPVTNVKMQKLVINFIKKFVNYKIIYIKSCGIRQRDIANQPKFKQIKLHLSRLGIPNPKVSLKKKDRIPGRRKVT